LLPAGEIGRGGAKTLVKGHFLRVQKKTKGGGTNTRNGKAPGGDSAGKGKTRKKRSFSQGDFSKEGRGKKKERATKKKMFQKTHSTCIKEFHRGKEGKQQKKKKKGPKGVFGRGFNALKKGKGLNGFSKEQGEDLDDEV